MTTSYISSVVTGAPALRRLRMTTERRTQFAKVASARFDKYEEQLKPSVTAALDDYLKAMRLRIGLPEESLPADSLAADASPQPREGSTAGLSKAMKALMDGDPDPLIADLKTQTSQWVAALDKHIMPTYRKIVDDLLSAGLKDHRTAGSLRTWRGTWLAARRQELVGVPDSVTSILRTALSALSQANGTSVYDAKLAVRAMLSNGYPSWTARADLIARTETISASNQSGIAQFASMADVAGQTGTVTWLATEDAKTREDHANVDGTTITIGDFFTVGDDQMNGPGDPNASIGNLANCRCAAIFGFADGTEETVDSDSLEASAAPTDAPTGVAIMGVLSATDTARFTIPDVPAPDAPGFHVTLAYLAEPAASYTDAQQQSLISALGTVSPQCVADVFGEAVFNDDDGERDPALVALVQSDGLSSLHDDVGDVLAQLGMDVSDAFPIWVPHVTLAYNATADQFPDGLVGSQVTFDQIVVGWAGEQLPVKQSDASGDDATVPALTAAQEADVTAPVDTPPVDAPAPTTDGADGGDTAAPGNDLTPQGVTWSGPIAMLDVPSQDGRMITAAGLTVRPLPLPLSFQKSYSHDSFDQNDEVVTVGRILSAEVRGGQLWATGDFLDPMINFDVEQAMATIDSGLGLVSVDLAITEMAWADPAGNPIDPVLWDGDGMDVITVALESSLGGVTIVPFPAFEDARITLDDTVDPDAIGVNAMPIDIPGGVQSFAAATPPAANTIADDDSSVTLTDGTVVEVGDLIAYPATDGTDSTEVGTVSGIDGESQSVTVTPTAAADGAVPPDITVALTDLGPATPVPAPKSVEDPSLTASSEVRPYTAKHFAARKLDGPTPLTVDPATGEVFGHLATFGECHIGKAAEGVCVTAPHSKTDYSYFHLSPILTDDGPLDVGKITLGTGHAGPRADFANTVAHYDNTGTAVAVVRATEDEFGIQVSGQLIHDTPTEKVEELMRSPLSGDWRSMGGNLELTAALAVNVPGFPIRRAVTGMSKVGQRSLVAASMVEPVQKMRLPSGAVIDASDMDALVAAAMQAMERGRRVVVTTEAQSVARDAARLRLARARLASV